MMRKMVFALFLFFCGRLAAQEDWKTILQKSEACYTSKNSGSFFFTEAYKNVLKSDTQHYARLFIYGGRTAWLGDAEGAAIFYHRNDSAFFIDPATKTYSASADRRGSRLHFLPHWNAVDFFKPYFIWGKLNGVERGLSPEGWYVLQFSNKKDWQSILCIDPQSYHIVRYGETHTHKKYGNQYHEYAFEERQGAEVDDVSVSLENILLQYRPAVRETTRTYLEKQAESQNKRIGNRINPDTLQRAIFGNNYTGGNGRYVLLDFYYHTCLPCIKAIPALNELQSRYDTSKLLVVGVNTRKEDEGQAKPFIERHGVKYLLIEGEAAAKTTKLSLAGTNISYPTLVLIKPDGTIENIYPGYVKKHYRQIGSYLEKVLGESR